ncbi:MAG TPA: hypothetical protein VG733_19990 [Chthoniobacteraceae bacterium]|nr:hypothetical protein [Chthoniobacteraceae bacterium]
MNWLNINLTTLRSPAYLGSTPVERATWLQLLAYCADQENGGRIAGAASWKDRQWQQICGVTAREVRAASRLVTIEGGDVCVHFFPLDKQLEVQLKREAGRRGGSARSEEKVTAAQQNGAKGGRPPSFSEAAATAAGGGAQSAPSEEAVFCAVENPSTNPTERNGKEGNNKEKESAARPCGVQRTASAADDGEGAGCAPVCYPPQAVEYGARLSPPCPEQWSLKWWEDSERRGWLGPDGLRIVKWQPALSSYWRGVQEMERRMQFAAGPGAASPAANGSAVPGTPRAAPPPGRERVMSAYEIKTRIESIDDELSRLRQRAKDGRSPDGLRTIKLYTAEQETRRQQLLQAKEALRGKLVEV